MNTALLVIDVQQSFRERASWADVSDPGIVETTRGLVDAARAGGHEVVWVLHAEPGTGGVFDPASGHVHPIAPLAPEEGEVTVVKTSRNAFTTTNLQQHLTARGVGRLVIAGIQTEQCCETTARLAADLGYAVVFVTEATATFPLVAPSGRELSTAEVIERTEAALSGRFARIATVADAFSGE